MASWFSMKCPHAGLVVLVVTLAALGGAEEATTLTVTAYSTMLSSTSMRYISTVVREEVSKAHPRPGVVLRMRT